MKRFSISIGNKILGGFLILVLIFALNAFYSRFTLNKSDRTIDENAQIIRPSLDALNEFTLMVTRSKMYITNWVYLVTTNNKKDKDLLVSLLDYDYPALNSKLDALQQSWEDPEQKAMLDSAFQKFEELMVHKRTIMRELKTFEDYDDPMKKFVAEDALETQVLEQSTELIGLLNQLSAKKNEEMRVADDLLQSDFTNLKRTNLMLGAIIVLIGVVAGIFLSQSITRPIVFLKGIIIRLGRGELPEDQQRKYAGDEIGEMAEAVNKLMEGMRSTSHFAEDIGTGNYESEFTPLSDQDVLGNALLNMRANLKSVAESDRQRNWANEGIAKFGEILRRNTNNLEEMADEVVSSLVDYMGANQGGVYVVNEADEFSEENEDYMTLEACYAWDKKKYLDQRIFPGDGLTGQSWMEKDTIYMTEVPQDYIQITSGLGEATPGSILIVPMIINEQVYGVIELASFDTFEDYQIEFVEKVAESIASALSSVQISAKTQRLLEESTELTEQMRAQEEEMRQNMEELQATQEEMQRAQRDREEKERIINSTTMLFELDSDMSILSTNDVVTQILGYQMSEMRGHALEKYVISRAELQAAIEKISLGRSYSGVFKMLNSNDDPILVRISAGQSYDPAMDENRYLFFGVDVTNVTSEG